MLEGTLFAGRYRIVKRLGAGAMGAVYEAIDQTTARPRALKIMHPHAAPREHLRARFRVEAQVAGQVGSPFLVDVLNAGVDETTDTPYLVMELLRGEDLAQRVARDAPLLPEVVVELLADVARGLDAMHALGIVHRDLKPSNLFAEALGQDRVRVKILDFGIAKIVEEMAGGESTAAAGTPLYMAPEQFRGRHVTGAADIYAFGMIAFTLLVGEPYWRDERDEFPAPVMFALAVAKGPRQASSERAAKHHVALPIAFDRWLERASSADAAQRFRSAGAAVVALAEALGVPAPELAVTPEVTTRTRDHGGDEGARDAGRTASDASAHGATTTRQDEPSDTPTVTPRTSAAPAETKPTSRATRALAGLVAASIAAAAAVVVTRPSPSPLATGESILACPILEASGIDEPAGWLGAAAAATACERARVILGGRTDRTRIPAELLDLPKHPVDDYPLDPFAAPDARARSIAAAKARASAYLDGSVRRDAVGFRVELVLRRPDGSEIGRASAGSPALYRAVRDAMSPLVAKQMVPEAKAIDPTVAAFSGARDLHGALALVDLTLAFAHNAGTLNDECARAESAGLSDLMRAAVRFQCAYATGAPTKDVALPPPDTSSVASRITHARLRHMISRVDEPSVVADLRGLFDHEPSAWGRSTIAATGSCLLQSTSTERASELSFQAIQAEPKNPTGEFCAPWGQLLAMTLETASAPSVVHAMQAWTPWDGNAWLYQTSLPATATSPRAFAARAYLLSPNDAYVAGLFADYLLKAGAREEARGVALALLAAGSPVDRAEGDLLLVRVDASEARFGAALGRARRAMEISSDDVGWVRVQRLEIAWRAVELANVLGRASEVADLVVARFLEPEPPPLDGANITVPMRLPAICARASTPVALRCFARFSQLRPRLSGGIIPETAAFADGAERYVRGDFQGAARAFRPLLRDPGLLAEMLSDIMESTFEHTGESELVERLEAAALRQPTELNGGSLAMARAAKRAAQRGNHEQARSLAKRVVAAWSVADETVPAVEEMRRLLASE
jgi:serine/threonine protein kinase